MALHLLLARALVLLGFAGFLLALLRWQPAARSARLPLLSDRALALLALATELLLVGQAAVGAALARELQRAPGGLHMLYGLGVLIALPAAHIYGSASGRSYARWMALGFLVVVVMSFRAAQTAGR
jgi:hypothetical protein